MRSIACRFIFLLALCTMPFAFSGCIATARAGERETVVNWQERCASKCAGKKYSVTMYHEDGRVEEMAVAIYDFSNNVGCFCPLAADKK